MQQRSVVVLGSTGSVGTQAVGLIAENPERFTVAGIAAGGRQPAVIAEQAVALRPRTVAVADTAQLAEVTDAVAAACRTAGIAVPMVVAGAQAVTELAGSGADVVLNGITGAVGLESTLAALRAGSTLALANKESLVVGGALVAAAQQRPDQIVPVDSEHAAIAQCLRSGTHAEVSRLVLTASGGPFRGWTPAQLAEVDVTKALAHPTWSMGPVITVNSATLVNKALEVIEAHLLFDVPIEQVGVVVHPQSVVHSMVEFVDGSTLAQLSPASMLIPIAWGLSWPERLPGAAPACDWSTAASWTFEPLDEQTFPAVQLARDAVAASVTHPAVLNAANEVCVDAFLGGRLRFDRIVPTVARVIAEHTTPDDELTVVSLEAVQRVARDAAARYVDATHAG